MTLLHADASERQLIFFTRFVLGVWVVQYLTHPFEEIAILPIQAVSPTGIVAWLPSATLAHVVDEPVLFGLRLVLLTLCFAGMSASLFPLVSPWLCAGITFELSLNRSFGHVAHAEVPLLLVTYVLASFAVVEWWRERLHPTAPCGYNRFAPPLVVASLLFCATYSLVGVVRLTTQPLEIFTSDTMIWSILKHSSRPWLLDFEAWLWVTRWPWLMALVDVGFAIATIFEVMAPLALLSRGFRRMFLVVIFGFHVAVIVLMELPFVHHLLLLVLLVDWSRWLGRSEPGTRGAGESELTAPSLPSLS